MRLQSFSEFRWRLTRRTNKSSVSEIHAEEPACKNVRSPDFNAQPWECEVRQRYRTKAGMCPAETNGLNNQKLMHFTARRYASISRTLLLVLS